MGGVGRDNILLMEKRSSFQIENLNLSYRREGERSESKNRLRKSLDNVKNLRIELHKLRTSFSNSSLSYIEGLARIKKAPSGLALNLKRVDSTVPTSPTKLKSRLDVLGEKLKNAKKEMQGDHDSPGVKTARKQNQRVESPHSEPKDESQETERFKEKASTLASYVSACPRPSYVRPVSHNPYSIRGNKYYVSEVIRAINEKNSLAMQHINQSMQMLLQYKLFKINQEGHYDEDKIILPPRLEETKKKTLILDLDQTLIHCFENSEGEPDIKLKITIEDNTFEIGFNIRPYAISFLKKMKKKWEIIVFTASHQSYADTILDEIDPDRTLFDHRLYRQHCRELTAELYVKDLSKLNRDLSQTVLVDNSAYSYAMQLDNGIPILPFYQGKDFQLAALQAYLQKLQQSQDVRTLNRQYFQLHKYTSFDNSYDLVDEVYRKKFT